MIIENEFPIDHLSNTENFKIYIILSSSVYNIITDDSRNHWWQYSYDISHLSVCFRSNAIT